MQIVLAKLAHLCPPWVRRHGMKAVAVYILVQLAFLGPELRYHVLERLTAFDVNMLAKLAGMIVHN
jgi:glycerol-3-phosphate acyltransferase PlsY